LGENSRKIACRWLDRISNFYCYSFAFKKAEHPFDCFKQQRRSRYYLNDLEQLIGEQDVLFYPGSFRRPYQIEETDNANVLLRAEVLNHQFA
jgi:transcription-repair coupling factor (superfamily II helicase)